MYEWISSNCDYNQIYIYTDVFKSPVCRDSSAAQRSISWNANAVVVDDVESRLLSNCVIFVVVALSNEDI